MRSLFPAVILVLLTFCSPGNNRRVGDTEAARDTMPAPAPPATADANTATTPSGILSQMNVTNTTEIQLSRMAAAKAQSADVKKLAEKLAVDHSKNREQVRALAQKLNTTVIPAAGGDVMAVDSAALPADLRTKSGTEFDRAFVEHQIRDHESNIEKIQSQMLPAAQQAEIKVYLERTLADMQGHLATLREVQQKISS